MFKRHLKGRVDMSKYVGDRGGLLAQGVMPGLAEVLDPLIYVWMSVQ